MTTNKNNVMTAPTYTKIKISDKNSARNIIHTTAIAKNVTTNDNTLRTGLRAVITANPEPTAIIENR